MKIGLRPNAVFGQQNKVHLSSIIKDCYPQDIRSLQSLDALGILPISTNVVELLTGSDKLNDIHNLMGMDFEISICITRVFIKWATIQVTSIKADILHLRPFEHL